MQHHSFGGAGTVPALGQGTWNLDLSDRRHAVATLRRGIELGLTHIDTAELYGGGAAEAVVGEAIRGQRDRVFLVSKVVPSNASRRGVLAACERSLRHLGVDSLDCYLLHWPGPHPLEETFAAFEQLKADGKIRSYGVSNFDEHELAEAIALAGPGALACNQVLYHLRERNIEHEVLPLCERHGIALVGYTPFGRSRFPMSGPAGATLEKVATRCGATARQVALAFLTRLPALFAIPKASSLEHVEENAGASALALTADDLAELDRAFPRGGHRPGVAML